MNHPSLSSNGKRIAAVIAIACVLFLPKRVDCGFPGAGKCEHRNRIGLLCTTYELEPFGFYLIESVVGSDVGFAYSTDEDCH